jgi:hypothetical protein
MGWYQIQLLTDNKWSFHEESFEENIWEKEFNAEGAKNAEATQSFFLF